jgi:hypothetical protein
MSAVLMIAIFGGLLITMGQHDRSEALFYYFRLEDQVPQNHLLRRSRRTSQFFLAAAAQNIKRLVRLLSQPTTPTVEAAT